MKNPERSVDGEEKEEYRPWEMQFESVFDEYFFDEDLGNEKLFAPKAKIKHFITDLLQAERQKCEEMVEAERERILEMIGHLPYVSQDEYMKYKNGGVIKWKELKVYFTEKEKEETGDWSQCNDCFDGLHDKCIGIEYGCECKHKITQPNNPK
jgi:hypothetical protein